jgi:hypothetical protein
MKIVFQNAIIILLMAVPFIGISQESSEFEKFLDNTFEVNLSNLDNGNNIAPFLKAFSEDLVWVNADVAIDGRVTQLKSDKDGLRKGLKQLQGSADLNVKWVIEKYNDVSKVEETRIAKFEVSVSLFAGKDLISTGINHVQVIAKKMDGFYSITYISVLQISDKLYFGPCYVHISKTEKDNFVTTTSFPNGTDYEFVEKKITFSESNGKKVVEIEGVDQKYFWNPKMNTVSMEMDGGRKIGSATETNGIMLVVLKDQASEKCAKMVITKK